MGGHYLMEDSETHELFALNEGELELANDLVEDPELLEDYTIPAEESSFRSFFTKRRILVITLLVILCMLVMVSVATVVPAVVLTRSNNDSHSPAPATHSPANNSSPITTPPTPDSSTEFVRNSREYQITYSDYSVWLDRNSMVTQFNEQASANNPYLDLSSGIGQESVRTQYKILTAGEKRCYNDREIRVREYQSGYGAHTSYVDIKSNSWDRDKACDVPFWPAETYHNTSRQKCERDVHECNDKFSHETRIFFSEQHHSIDTCYDLLLLYPWAFDELPEEHQGNPVDVYDLNPWWTLVYKGQMDGDTNYEIAFTLRYSTLEEATSGTHAPPVYGEWSIRIYSVDDGMSESWNEPVVDATRAMWLSLIEEFGNQDNFGNCE